MATLNSRTVFLKDVLALMQRFEEAVDPRTAKWISDCPVTAALTNDSGEALMLNVAMAIHGHLEHNPEHALELMTSVTEFLPAKGVRTYAALVDQLVLKSDLHPLWINAVEERDVYAFALFVVLTSQYIPKRNGLAKIVSAVLRQPFQFGPDYQQWSSEFTLALFGPVWHALYMTGALGPADYIDLIMQQRPALLMGAQPIAGSTAVLPSFEV